MRKANKVWSIGMTMDLALITLFILLLGASGFYQYTSQRGMVEDLVRKQTNELAESYFDNINTLMLTGGMANREIPRTKIMSREEILDARSVEQAEQVGQVLDQITTEVNQINHMNEQIAVAAKEQSTVASEMNQDVVGINEVTNSTAASSEQLAQVSHVLAELAVDLQRLVEQFKV